MNDRDEFLALIARWGLVPDNEPIYVPGLAVNWKDVAFTAQGSGATPERKLTGYNGFCATFSFDENGKFMELGVYE